MTKIVKKKENYKISTYIVNYKFEFLRFSENTLEFKNCESKSRLCLPMWEYNFTSEQWFITHNIITSKSVCLYTVCTPENAGENPLTWVLGQVYCIEIST